MGRAVSFTCDGCPAELKARIIYVSPRAEFTPPVIYSQTARTKLVFLVEARPDGATQATLRPACRSPWRLREAGHVARHRRA